FSCHLTVWARVNDVYHSTFEQKAHHDDDHRTPRQYTTDPKTPRTPLPARTSRRTRPRTLRGGTVPPLWQWAHLRWHRHLSRRYRFPIYRHASTRSRGLRRTRQPVQIFRTADPSYPHPGCY